AAFDLADEARGDADSTRELRYPHLPEVAVHRDELTDPPGRPPLGRGGGRQVRRRLIMRHAAVTLLRLDASSKTAFRVTTRGDRGARMTRVAIAGFGAIGRELAAHLARGIPAVELARSPRVTGRRWSRSCR